LQSFFEIFDTLFQSLSSVAALNLNAIWDRKIFKSICAEQHLNIQRETLQEKLMEVKSASVQICPAVPAQFSNSRHLIHRNVQSGGASVAARRGGSCLVMFHHKTIFVPYSLICLKRIKMLDVTVRNSQCCKFV
ncbi:hypothetical protein T11_9806, partial [Trichinella zimbabwensis]